MLKIWVPEELAPEARELLLAFWDWLGDPDHEGMLKDDAWTGEQMIDLFIMEATVDSPDA